jgi:mutator protein MutT
VVGVGAIILRRGRVLLVQRGRPPARGKWSLPGGAVEPGERLEDAVRREVSEETGLKVLSAKAFEIFERIIRDRRGRVEYHYVLVDFLCRVSGGAPAPADDADDVEWVEVDNLAGRPVTEGTAEVIRRAFRRVRMPHAKH